MLTNDIVSFKQRGPDIFLISPQKHNYVVWTQKRLSDVLLISTGTHNICFHGEIRKVLCGYPILYGAMYKNLDKLTISW